MSYLRHIGGAAAVLLFSVSPLVGQDGPPAGTTFVYLNSADIIQSTPGSVEAQRTFEREIADMRTELQTQATAVDSLLRDYQRQESLLSPQAKEQKQGEIRNLQAQLETRRQEMETQAGQRQQDLLRPILERVSGVIESIRGERNYAMVFDISTEGVVAADPSLDITDLVKTRLGAAADSTAAAQP
ncbi:MAG: OmpH family outer membrane protein [Rhodothermia bacterium]